MWYRPNTIVKISSLRNLISVPIAVPVSRLIASTGCQRKTKYFVLAEKVEKEGRSSVIKNVTRDAAFTTRLHDQIFYGRSKW